MENVYPKPSAEELAAVKAKYGDAMKLQEIESNPLDDEDLAMFAMFEREGWSEERRLKYMREQALGAARLDAAE